LLQKYYVECRSHRDQDLSGRVAEGIRMNISIASFHEYIMPRVRTQQTGEGPLMLGPPETTLANGTTGMNPRSGAAIKHLVLMLCRRKRSLCSIFYMFSENGRISLPTAAFVFNMTFPPLTSCNAILLPSMFPNRVKARACSLAHTHSLTFHERAPHRRCSQPA
jgi:hypothetical protein